MKHSFPLHDLSSDEFERLVVHVCMKVLGTGTIVFADGKDGGRDGTFNGVAEAFPSTAASLNGKFVIQAKHTSDPVASCSDREFARLIDGEKLKIAALIADGELEHYIVFTNRRKPAGKAVSGEKALVALGLRSAHILGAEQIREWLTAHPDIWRNLGFDRYDTKFAIDPTDLADVIRAFHTAVSGEDVGPSSATDFRYAIKTEKNRINGLTAEYDRFIRENSLRYFAQIEAFLKNPRNEDYRDYYHDTADELKEKILTRRADFANFDAALTYVYDQIVERAPNLRRRKRYVRVFLHYMYWTCDIGQHADSDQTSRP